MAIADSGNRHGPYDVDRAGEACQDAGANLASGHDAYFREVAEVLMVDAVVEAASWFDPNLRDLVTSDEAEWTTG